MAMIVDPHVRADSTLQERAVRRWPAPRYLAEVQREHDTLSREGTAAEVAAWARRAR